MVQLVILEIARHLYRIFCGNNAEIREENAAYKAILDATANLLKVLPHYYDCPSLIAANRYFQKLLSLLN